MSETELLQAMCEAYWKAAPGITNSMRAVLAVVREHDRRWYLEALQFYARPEHWMALTDDADADRRLLVAHSHLEASGNGWSVAMSALMGAAIDARGKE